jgi:hypothetical protein
VSDTKLVEAISNLAFDARCRSAITTSATVKRVLAGRGRAAVDAGGPQGPHPYLSRCASTSSQGRHMGALSEYRRVRAQLVPLHSRVGHVRLGPRRLVDPDSAR